MSTEGTQASQETTLAATPAPSEAAPASDQSTPASTPAESPASDIPENWEYTGDRNAVPKPLQNYVKGLDRYWTKRSQAFADAERKAKEYDQWVNSDGYKQYQQFMAQQQSPTGFSQPQAPQAPMVTQEEADAILSGDTKVLESVIARSVEAKVAEKERAYQAQIAPIAMKQKELETGEMVKSFAELHPDFWELYDAGYEDYLLTSIKNGAPLEVAYSNVKKMEQAALARAEEKHKKIIEEKRNGSVVGKTVTGTPDVVYAKDANEAMRLRVQMAMKGDPRQVQIKQ